MGRDRAAIDGARAALEQAQQRAAAVEAFELAARIHLELKGLEWITCPQRVTSLSRADADIYGWSAGLLVQFHVDAGRLVGWAASRCDFASAEPLIATTPLLWQDFARSNAELATKLHKVETDRD